MKQNNRLWNFFSSVKLALFTICALASTSIIGTLIPQKKQFGFYAKEYGEGVARFFYILDFQNMYESWWFLGLLALLSANLIVCSIDRFPSAWKQIKADTSATPVSKLAKMKFSQTFTPASPVDASFFQNLLQKGGWKIQQSSQEEYQIIAGQKGGWTRLGVYIVHLSILVIFAGAIFGYFFGFKGSVMIPETKQTDRIFDASDQQPLELGFTVRCDYFGLDYYENGMVKEYRSLLTVMKNGTKVLSKEIEVNAPLKYNGVTFYQASYEGYRDFIITIDDNSGTEPKVFVNPFQQQTVWSEKNIRFGVINAEAISDRVVRLKMWFKAEQSEPTTFWLKVDEQKSFEHGGKTYTMTGKQMYATGLQVAKDPGVWLVYLGCGLMMLGLYLAFFMSHRKIWIAVPTNATTKDITIAGTTNKNAMGFEKTFSEMVTMVSEKLP